MSVPVRIAIVDGEPTGIEADIDHAVECSLALPSGRLLVDECTGDPVATLELDPGTYAVRILYRGLDTLDDSGLEGDDHYEILLWPSQETPLRVLKRWSPTARPN